MLPVEEAIIEKLRKDGLCSLDDLVTALSSFDFGEIFIAVDRLSSDGRVLLRHRGGSTYQLSLGAYYGEAWLSDVEW
jgi:hypothetical protein